MLKFFIGLFIGGFFGVILTAVATAGKNNDEGR